jgi:DNA-binding CsgD family transcriptional regulator
MNNNINDNEIRQELPPGLEDNCLEIYAINDALKVLYKGSSIDFWQLPTYIIEAFRLDFFRKQVINYYKSIGYTNEDDMLYQHVKCNYGGWNRTPDYNGTKSTPEYWNCGKRGKCKHEGVLCVRLSDSDKNPTPQELRIMELITAGLCDKEIAAKLGTSYHTVTTQRQTIERKIQAPSKVSVASFVLKNNLFVSPEASAQ